MESRRVFFVAHLEVRWNASWWNTIGWPDVLHAACLYINIPMYIRYISISFVVIEISSNNHWNKVMFSNDSYNSFGISTVFSNLSIWTIIWWYGVLLNITFGPRNQVLGPQYMGHNPKKWRFGVLMVCFIFDPIGNKISQSLLVNSKRFNPWVEGTVWHKCWCDLGVSENSGNPEIIHFNRVFHYKPFVLGYPYFWKHPNL